MFLKYILVPELSENAKTQCVALHPTKPIMALSVYDTTHEIFLLEYSFRESAKAQASQLEVGNSEPEQLRMGFPPGKLTENGSNMLMESIRQERSLNPGQQEATQQESLDVRTSPHDQFQSSSRANPEFKIVRTILREKTGTVIDLRWNKTGDTFYAVKNKNFTIYDFDEKKNPVLKVKHSYEESLEISAFCLGPADGEFAFGTLDGRMIANFQITQLNEKQETGSKIVSLVWDPLGKFICWLNITNTLSVFNIDSKKIETTVNLNIKLDNSELIVTKDERKMEFTPDLNYLLVPSLDDKKMPFMCALRRSAGFVCEYVFAGPFSPITSLRCHPTIFESRLICDSSGNNAYYSVFAMGDAYGQISLWEVGEKKNRETPVVFLKSDDSGMTVGNLEFDPLGRYMLASTDKRFILVVCFGKEFDDSLGTKMSACRYIEDHYGSARAGVKEVMKTYKDLMKSKPIVSGPTSNSKMYEESVPPAQNESSLAHQTGSMLNEAIKPPVIPEQTIKPSLGEPPSEIKAVKHYKKGKRVDVVAPTSSSSNGLGPAQSALGEPQAPVEPATTPKLRDLGDSGAEFTSSKQRPPPGDVDTMPLRI